MMSEFKFIKNIAFFKYPHLIAFLIFNEILGAFLVLFSVGAFIPFLGGLTNGDKHLDGPVGDVFDILGISNWSSIELLFLIVVLLAVRVVLDGLRNYGAGLIGVKVDREIKLELNSSLESATYRSFSLLDNSKYSQAMMFESLNAAAAVRDLASTLSYSILLVILLSWMAINSSLVFLVVGCVCVIYFKVNKKLLSKVAKVSLNRINKTAELNTKIIDSKYLFKFLSAEKSVFDLTFSIKNVILRLSGFFKKQLGLMIISNAISGSVGILIIASVASIHFLFFDSNGTDLLFDLALLQRISSYVEAFQSKRAAMREKMPSYELCYDLVNQCRSISEVHHEESSEAVQFSRKIDLIGVQVDLGNRTVLNDVNLSLNSKGLVLLTGPSGSGKTTLAETILGLNQLSSGEIRVDDCVVNIYENPHWGRQVAYVPQDAYIPSGTLREYLKLGSGSVSEEDMLLALSKAKIVHAVERLPQGLDTVIGGDINFSGGERQRICIARALLRNAKIIVLDEPSSALDSKTESEIFMSLEELSKEVLILVITHSNEMINKSLSVENVKLDKINSI